MPDFDSTAPEVPRTKFHAQKPVRLDELQVALERSEADITKGIKGADESPNEGVDPSTIAGAREAVIRRVTGSTVEETVTVKSAREDVIKRVTGTDDDETVTVKSAKEDIKHDVADVRSDTTKILNVDDPAGIKHDTTTIRADTTRILKVDDETGIKHDTHQLRADTHQILDVLDPAGIKHDTTKILNVEDRDGIKHDTTRTLADTTKILDVLDPAGIKHDTIAILRLLQPILTRVYHYTFPPITPEQAGQVWDCLRVIVSVEHNVSDKDGNLEPTRSDERTKRCLSLLEGKPIQAWFQVVLSDFQADDVSALLERFQQLQELRQALILHFTLPSFTSEPPDKVWDCLRVIIDVEERVVKMELDLDTINRELREFEEAEKTQGCLTFLRSEEGEPILAQKFQDVFSKFQTVDVPVRLMRYQQLQELRQALIQHFTATADSTETADSTPSTRRRRTGRTDVQP